MISHVLMVSRRGWCLSSELEEQTLTCHCGPGQAKPEDATNHRNGSSAMTVREIQGFLAEMYAVDVSQTSLSALTKSDSISSDFI